MVLNYGLSYYLVINKLRLYMAASGYINAFLHTYRPTGTDVQAGGKDFRWQDDLFGTQSGRTVKASPALLQGGQAAS
jgi:hypothetical protein